MKTVAIVQARMGSTRLPGKVMTELADKTVLGHVIARLQSCSRIDAVVIATTTSGSDDVIVREAERCGVGWFRGSEEDVLVRYHGAAVEAGAEVVVRATSDNPLVDPQLLTRMLDLFHEMGPDGTSLDYVSYTVPPSYPVGAGAEVVAFHALERAFKESTERYEREHVTPYIYGHPELFKIRYQTNETDLSDLRWTLDTEDDLRLIQAVYARLYVPGRIFTAAEILALYESEPELRNINSHIRQKTLKD